MTQNPQDKRQEMIIGHTLRIGVIAAATLVLAGGILYLAENAFAPAHCETFHPVAKHALNLSASVRNALALNSLGIIQLGLLVLIATPIVRVILSVVTFALERDVLYAVVTSIVLVVLLYSLLAKGA